MEQHKYIRLSTWSVITLLMWIYFGIADKVQFGMLLVFALVKEKVIPKTYKKVQHYAYTHTRSYPSKFINKTKRSGYKHFATTY